MKILGSSLERAPIESFRKKKSIEKHGSLQGKVKLSASDNGLTGEAEASGERELKISETLEFDTEQPTMKVSHFHTQDSVGFRIEPFDGGRLDGQPWEAGNPRLTIQDMKADRKRGEAPSPSIQVQCRRQDLIIENIQYKSKRFDFLSLSREKQIAVEQALKAEIFERGLTCGDLSEPFSRLIIADIVAPQE